MTDEQPISKSTNVRKLGRIDAMFVAVVVILTCVVVFVVLRPQMADAAVTRHNAAIRDEYIAQFTVWRDHDFDHYRFTLTRAGVSLCSPATIEVLNNKVVAVEVDSMLDNEEDCLVTLQDSTINDIYKFGVYIEGTADRPTRVDVSYQDYGVPTQVTLTFPNGEVSAFTISDFEILDDE